VLADAVGGLSVVPFDAMFCSIVIGGRNGASVAKNLHEIGLREPGRMHLLPDSKESAEAHDEWMPFLRVDMRSRALSD
jgi:hypothetical protein